MEKQLALFDFDGTITTKDTLLEYMSFCRGTIGALWVFLRLIPHAILFALKRINNQEFKERYLKLSFSGASEAELKEKAEKFTRTRLQKLIRPKALERIDWHRLRGHRIVIVSASTDLWLKPWCDQMELELISSKLEVIDGKLTGKIDGLNCRGPQKVVRIKEEIDTESYEKTYAYGDSSGDKEMLEFADDGQYRPFE